MNANLPNTRTNPMKGLPVFCTESFLKAIDLVSGFSLSDFGKMLPEIFFHTPNPDHSLHSQMYQN